MWRVTFPCWIGAPYDCTGPTKRRSCKESHYNLIGWQGQWAGTWRGWTRYRGWRAEKISLGWEEASAEKISPARNILYLRGKNENIPGGRLNVSHDYQELGSTWSQWFSAFWTGSGGSPPSCEPASSSPPSCCWPSRSRWTRPGKAPRHPPLTRMVSWWSSGSAATSRTTSRWGTRGRWWSHCCSCWDNY